MTGAVDNVMEKLTGKVHIDKTNLRALMKRLRYLEYCQEYPSCNLPPFCFDSFTKAVINDIAFRSCIKHYRQYCRSGLHFKDRDLLVEWLFEIYKEEFNLSSGDADAKDESFQKIIVAEAVKEVKGSLTEAVIDELKAEIKQFLKENLLNPAGILGSLENVSFSIPVVGQFSAIGWLILMVIPSILLFPIFVWSILGLLPLPGCYELKVNFLWLQFDTIETWTMNCWYNALAALSAPAGVAVKWAFVKTDTWYRCGHGVTKGGGISLMKSVHGWCPCGNIEDEIEKTKKQLKYGNFSSDLKKIKEGFETKMKNKAALEEVAKATQDKVAKELEEEIEKTKNMSLKEFNNYMAKREKEHLKESKKARKDNLVSFEDHDVTFSDSVLIMNNVATQKMMEKDQEKAEAEKKKQEDKKKKDKKEEEAPDGPDNV